MLYAENKIRLEPVFVMKGTLEIHTKDVDQNVSATQTVQETELVLETNVKILVLVHVESMPIVLRYTTLRLVLA